MQRNIGSIHITHISCGRIIITTYQLSEKKRLKCDFPPIHNYNYCSVNACLQKS